MKETWKMSARHHSGSMARALAAVLAFILGLATAVWAQSTRPNPDPKTFPYRDLTLELENKMSGTYVVAAVGDVLIQEPIGKMVCSKIQKILREADTTIGNMESTIVDRRNFPNGLKIAGNWAPKETAADLAELGFDLMNGANNHTWDMGEEGLKSNIKWLDEQGIPLSGVGRNLDTARMPVFQHTAKGRVGMVGAYSISRRSAMACDREGNMISDGGYMGTCWGFNPLRVNAWNVVTPEQLRQLKAIRDSIVARRDQPDIADPINIPKDEEDRVQIFDARYIAGPKPGNYHYEVNQADRQANLLAIRTTKEYGDFAIFTMHTQQNRYAFQGLNVDYYPNQFVIDFAHDLIDNGADMFVGHGHHNIQPVEIYKGKPIFYNLSSLVLHEILVDGVNVPEGMTPVEDDELYTDRLQRPHSMMGLVATSKYQDGKLVEVRLYPFDLGVGKNRPWSKMSIAQTPSPELAQEILTKVQELSEPFGTKISIENGVGVIRVPPEATVPVGADIRSTFKKH